MNTPADQAAPLSHQTAQQLLPWLLAGTLDGAELARVQRHVHACAQCQVELEWQRKLLAAAQAPRDCAFDADRAYAKLLPRLGPQAPRAGSGILGRWRSATAANSPWLRWTALAQLAVIGVLGVMLARPGRDADDFRALGSAAQSQGQLVVVFKPATTEREMRRILQTNGARVIDGPTVTEAYILALPASQANAALGRMRAEPAVTLVQPLSAENRP
jgi:hypothetical protein